MKSIPFGEAKYKDIENAYRTLHAAPIELKQEFFALWLDSIKEAVDAWGEGEKDDAKLTPFIEKAQIAEGMLCQLFGRLTGYVAHDFLEMFAATHPPLGRERLYSQEDNIFFAVFIEELMTRGSSLTQAIELLYTMWDKTGMSPEGLRKQMREAHKEARTSKTFWDDVGKDRLLTIMITWLRNCNLYVDIKRDKGPFGKTLKAYRAMIMDMLNILKNGYPQLLPFIQKDFPWVAKLIQQEVDDPLSFIYTNFQVEALERLVRVRELFNCYTCTVTFSKRV